MEAIETDLPHGDGEVLAGRTLPVASPFSISKFPFPQEIVGFGEFQSTGMCELVWNDSLPAFGLVWHWDSVDLLL